jgi:cytochrome c oxidase subunit 4
MSTEVDPHNAHPVHVGEDLNANEFGHGQHGATDRTYIIIAVILSVVTGMEVTLTYIDVGPVFLPALLLLMAAKFLMVVSFFMHLKFDKRIFSFMFYMGLTLAIFVYVLALATFHYFGS